MLAYNKLILRLVLSLSVCVFLVVTSAYADIYAPTPVASVTDGVDDFDMLFGAYAITTVTLGDSTYALVAAHNGDGLQIIDITDPANPLPVATVTDGVDEFNTLNGPSGITTVTLGEYTYALVTAFFDDGVQFIDITDPASPVPVASVIDGVDGFYRLNGAYGITTVTIGASTYALVTAYYGDGVQIMDITDPANPLAVASPSDDVDGFDTLDGASAITTVTLGEYTYALVAAYEDDGVQIIDITDPANPLAVTSVTDGVDGFDRLNGATGITTVTLGAATYALVTGQVEDGVQIIDITDLASSFPVAAAPTPVASVKDGVDGFNTLNGAYAITTVTLGASTYALVTAWSDDGVQIINITDPANPVAVASVTNGVDGFDQLDGAYGITTVTLGEYTYALVTALYGDGVQIMDISTFCDRDESEYDYTIEGTANADYLLGTREDELILGLAGNDFIRGMGGDDCIYGGEGNDFIQAGSGDDVVFAGPGDDVVRTGWGVDVIYGEAGDDILHAVRRNGSNTLEGGDGVDICTKAGDRVTVTAYNNCEITDENQ